MEFVEHPRGDASGAPFLRDGRFHARWWDRWPPAKSAQFYGVALGGVEVARIQLLPAPFPEEYSGVPPFGWEMLKLHLLEVRADRRCEGLGTRVVEGLREAFPDRRFLAFSEADGFWDSVGWDRFEHPDGRSQSLFIQPEV